MSTPVHWHSRVAAGFVIVGLALSAAGILYLVFTEISVQSLPPPDKDKSVRAVQLSYELLFVIFMMFLIGSYAMIKVGRLFLSRPETRETEYVDAWGSYRVTQEEIEAVQKQWDEPGDAPPETGGDKPKPGPPAPEST